MVETLTVGAMALALLSLVTWVVHRMVAAALSNMRANTSAINASVEATHAIANRIDTDGKVMEERHRTLFKQLDRIEDKVSRK